MNSDTAPVVVGGVVSAWLTLESAQLYVGIGVGALTLIVLLQRIWINCRALRRDSKTSE
jgi:hypothetical protein